MEIDENDAPSGRVCYFKTFDVFVTFIGQEWLEYSAEMGQVADLHVDELSVYIKGLEELELESSF